VYPDMARPITGNIGKTGYGVYMEGGSTYADGAFRGFSTTGQRIGNSSGSSIYFSFASDLVVPTGPENAGRTMSAQVWRRVS